MRKKVAALVAALALTLALSSGIWISNAAADSAVEPPCCDHCVPCCGKCDG